MTHLPLALSLTSSFTKVGAIVAFAALVATAILSLLVFSQARELKRLREWAGRAPERAAELEQRVSSYAAARVQHTTGVAETVRPVPAAPPVTPVPPPAPGAAAATAGQPASTEEPTPLDAVPGAPPTAAPPRAHRRPPHRLASQRGRPGGSRPGQRCRPGR